MAPNPGLKGDSGTGDFHCREKLQILCLTPVRLRANPAPILWWDENAWELAGVLCPEDPASNP